MYNSNRIIVSHGVGIKHQVISCNAGDTNVSKALKQSSLTVVIVNLPFALVIKTGGNSNGFDRVNIIQGMR